MVLFFAMANADSDAAPGTLSITDRELFNRLRWFTYVRWVFGLFCLMLLLVTWHVLGVRFRSADGSSTMAAAVHVVLLLFLCNAVFTFLERIVRSRKQVTRTLIEWMALVQILCDLVVICLLVHRTGGVGNFFVILILVPIVIVTELLPQRVAYATALVAAGMLNLLAWGEQQGLFTHIRVELAQGSLAPVTQLYADPLYVLHVTAALTATLFAMVFVASTIAARLRTREAELEQAYQRLNSADETKSLFMRKAGHEMRAPLAAIQSILDAIGEVADDLEDRQRALIRRARHRCGAMMELVNDLLRYSRLRTAETSLKLTCTPLGEIVANTAELMDERAQAAGLTLACATQPLWVEGDEELLRQLVTNLVSNAIQYTPTGGRVEVGLTADGRHAVLTVSDTGIGIDTVAQGRVFQDFYRAPQAKEFFQDGTGLGLAIVKRIVDLHDGTIQIDSPPAGGTLFTVRVLLARPAPDPGRRPA